MSTNPEIAKPSEQQPEQPERTSSTTIGLRVKSHIRAGDGSQFHKDPPPTVNGGIWLNNHHTVVATAPVAVQPTIGLRVKSHVRAGDGSQFHKDDEPAPPRPPGGGGYINNHHQRLASPDAQVSVVVEGRDARVAERSKLGGLRVKSHIRAGDGSQFHKDDNDIPPRPPGGGFVNNHHQRVARRRA